MSADSEYVAGPLDGNAAASLLDQVFAFEATIADITCAGCGTVAPIGKVKLYGGPMGAVLRCLNCDGTLMRVVHTPYGHWLEMQGARSLFVPTSAE
jgi:hypothetical protein